MPAEIKPCPDCGLVVGPAEGPVHAYVGGSPGCWALQCELMTIGPGGGVPGQLAGDTYGAQHPGRLERRAIQSVCAHLISLGAALERDWPVTKAVDLLRSALLHPDWWRTLPMPRPIGTITVGDVMAESDPVRRGAKTNEWAADVWAAYSPHHALVNEWLDALIGPRRPDPKAMTPAMERRTGSRRR